jgi:hypothetical protein
VFALPAPAGPIQDKAQSFRSLADALDQRAQAHLDAHAATAQGNAGTAMDAAGNEAQTQAQTMTTAAADVRDHADWLDHCAALLCMLTIVVIAWQVKIRSAALLDPPAAALETAAGEIEIRAARKKIIKRLTEQLGKRQQRGGTQMNISERMRISNEAYDGREEIQDRIEKGRREIAKKFGQENADSWADGKYYELEQRMLGVDM